MLIVVRKFILIFGFGLLATSKLAYAQTESEMSDIMNGIRESQNVPEREATFGQMAMCAKISKVGANSIGKRQFRTYTDSEDALRKELGDSFVEDEVAFRTMAFVQTAVELAFQNITPEMQKQAEIDAFKMTFAYCQSMSNF